MPPGEPMARGRIESKAVLVSRGIYDGSFDIVSGVDVYGGYSPDFRDRDLAPRNLQPLAR